MTRQAWHTTASLVPAARLHGHADVGYRSFGHTDVGYRSFGCACVGYRESLAAPILVIESLAMPMLVIEFPLQAIILIGDSGKSKGEGDPALENSGEGKGKLQQNIHAVTTIS